MFHIYFYRQTGSSDCGPTTLRILLGYWGTFVQNWEITQRVPTQNKGWNLLQYSKAAISYGLKPNIKSIKSNDIKKLELPIVLLSHEHYVVLYKSKTDKFYVADPQKGKVVYKKDEFLSQLFNTEGECIGISFSLMPTFEKTGKRINNLLILRKFLSYYRTYQKQIIKIFTLVFIVGISQAFLPFISRAIIDTGLETSSWDFITLLLIGNIILVLTNILGSFAQVFLATHIANKIKICMLDDYFIKLLSMKYATFLRINVGDILQRITDNERIQAYFIGQLFNSIISTLFLIAFSFILLYFNYKLFIIYTVFALAYIGWNSIFLSQRKKLDFKFWNIKSDNNKFLIQMYNHIVDIKGFNYYDQFLNQWRKNISALYKQNINFLNFSQLQDVGGKILLQSKDLLLTYLSCSYVLEGQITLGTLFAIQYILGFLNSPLYILAEFMNQTQLIMISFNRLFDFNNQPDDESKTGNQFIPKSRDIILRDIYYRYPDGSIGLNKISVNFQSGKKYGIIGASGCGKSTLLKLLCGIIEPSIGEMYLGSTNIKSIDWNEMRKHISIVLQENKLVAGSILENIVGDTNNYNENRLIKAVETACIRTEIEILPEAYNTLIEGENKKLSKGQVQRILIARALYREADIYLFDEIDDGISLTVNKRITEKIDKYLQEKTRIYVTHRTESLEDADLIYVLNNGMLIDLGKYNELKERRRIS